MCFYASAFSLRAELPLSRYNMEVKLDHPNRTVTAITQLHFCNPSPVPIYELRFYMYLNSFKSFNSSFLKGTNTIFGRRIDHWTPEEMGYIEVDSIFRSGNCPKAALHHPMHYIQPNDNNPEDQSVLRVPLDLPIGPFQTQTFTIYWKAKMPKTIARMGYSQDFYLFCHWFPQLGVFQKDECGNWNWNCHQAFRNTEYYSDFADYEVGIEIDSAFKIGSTGSLTYKKANGGKVVYHYTAKNVIDFAWAIYPHAKEFEVLHRNTLIRLLVPYHYIDQAERSLAILKFALDYFEKNLEEYPYPTITVVCPPFHALRSGLMEYPRLITTGSFYKMPTFLRTMESLVVHEFAHQFFMAVVATNEKEEPWMDEGLATYYEDKIIDALFPLVSVGRFAITNKALTRVEYTSLAKENQGIVARPGWDFGEANYKALVYSKTATTLHSIERMLGDSLMKEMIRSYYQASKFKHPSAHDMIESFHDFLVRSIDSTEAKNILAFFQTALFDNKVIDWAVKSVTHLENKGHEPWKYSRIEMAQLGNWIIPTEVKAILQNGHEIVLPNQTIHRNTAIEVCDVAHVVSVEIDPHQKILLDINLNNNSLSLINEVPDKSNMITAWLIILFDLIGLLLGW